MAEKPTSSSTTYTTFGAPSGAFGGSNGVQSGTESRISTLIVPLNGSLILQSSHPSAHVIRLLACQESSRLVGTIVISPFAHGHVIELHSHDMIPELVARPASRATDEQASP